MWEDEEKSGKRIRTILIIVSIVLLVLLAAGVYISNQENMVEALALKDSSKQSQAVNDEKKAEVLNQIEADYAKDMDVVNTYLPGIVCWGDKTTGGSQNSVSYASELQNLIDENICDLYHFRGTLDYADNVSRVDWNDYTVEIPVVNMGVGEETTNTILGRNGAVPYVLRKDIVIPADSEPVEVMLLSQNGRKVAPLTGGDGGVNNVTIAGIEGKLALVSELTGKYTFTRLESGAETEVEAGTEVVTAASSMYRNYIPVVLMGAYGGYDRDIDILVEQNKELLEHQLGDNDRYIVLGVYETGENGFLSNTSYYKIYEDAMEKAFGDHFINLRRYLTSDAMSDLQANGITYSDMTVSDKNKLQVGLVPLCMRVSADSLELKADLYKLIGQVIYDRMDKLGYFDEVKEELGINDVLYQIKQAELEKRLNGSTN